MVALIPLIVWLAVIFVAVMSQWDIIEKKRRYPVKWFWFALRVIAAGLMTWWMVSLGYHLFLSLAYLAGSFWFPFYVGLNYARGKRIKYLSPRNSKFDYYLTKLFGGDVTRVWNVEAEHRVYMTSYTIMVVSVTLILVNYYFIP